MAKGQNIIGPWFALAATGTIQRQTNPVLRAGLIASGWIGFSTKADAEAWLKITPPIPGAPGAAHAIGSGIGAAESAATAVPDFLSRLTSGNLWIRVGEVVVGLILMAIGVNSMLKGKPLQIVTGAAGTVGKAAMLA